jgi:hypothetical protein
MGCHLIDGLENHLGLFALLWTVATIVAAALYRRATYEYVRLYRAAKSISLPLPGESEYAAIGFKEPLMLFSIQMRIGRLGFERQLDPVLEEARLRVRRRTWLLGLVLIAPLYLIPTFFLKAVLRCG